MPMMIRRWTTYSIRSRGMEVFACCSSWEKAHQLLNELLKRQTDKPRKGFRNTIPVPKVILDPEAANSLTERRARVRDKILSENPDKLYYFPMMDVDPVPLDEAAVELIMKNNPF